MLARPLLSQRSRSASHERVLSDRRPTAAPGQPGSEATAPGWRPLPRRRCGILTSVVVEPLIELLTDAASGRVREAEGDLRILPAPPGPAMAIVGLVGVHVIATSASEAWVRERLAGDLMGPLSPAFIVELGHQLRRVDDGVDLVLVAPALHGTPSLRETAGDHPRIARASAHRTDVRAFTDETGQVVVVLGRGLGLRLEVSIEVTPAARGRGLGRQALEDARRLIPAGSLLFAQVAPANAASIRMLLHAGFVPLGAEVLFFTGQRATN